MDTFYLEAGIVGALLKDSRKAGEVFQTLSSEDFREEICRDAFTAMQQLFRAAAPISIATVAHSLEPSYGKTEDVPRMLQGFVGEAAADVGYYSRCLADARKLDDLKGYGTALSYARNIDEAQDVIRSITAQNISRGKNIRTALELALDFSDWLDRTSEKPPEYLDWGIAPLNERLLTELGDFVIIGGRPSAGKTMLAMQLALRLAQKHKVGFVSLETSAEKLTRRALSHLSEVPLWKLKKPWHLTPDDHKRLMSAEEQLSKLRLEIVSGGIRSTAQIEAAALNRRWEVVVVDYIQIARSSGNSRYEQVTNISADLHTMAQTHGICVIGLAQLSRGIKTVGGKEAPPTLESLRESGQLEQDADAVMLLYLENPDDRGSNRILKLVKNKEGECGSTSLFFNGETQTFLHLKS